MQTIQTHWFPFVRSNILVALSTIIGDTICQKISSEDPLHPQEIQPSSSDKTILGYHVPMWWDTERTKNMAISSFFVGAPLGYIIQQFLEFKFPGNSSKQIGKKMLFSFFISSPIQISLAFTTITLLKGYNMNAAKTKIENDLVSTMITGLVYWPFVGYMNLRYVPVVHRPLVGSFAGMIWNIYMSNQVNREHATLQDKKEIAA